MLKRLIGYNRFKDYINFKESEVKTSFVLSLFICILLYNLDFYENILSYKEVLSDILLCICGGFIGLIGFSLSGMAIMIGLFEKKQAYYIERKNGSGILEKLMSSFAFIAYAVGIGIIILFLLLILYNSKINTPQKVVFYIICFTIIYYVMFCIFYTIGLIFNCIDLFIINNIYEHGNNKEFFDKVNEIRIDYILSYVLKICDISKEDFLKGLDENSKNYTEEERRKIRKYFEQYYGK